MIEVCEKWRKGFLTMIIGIDVGGTHTDGVLLDGGQVCKTSKVLTHRNALDQSVLAALDALLTTETIDQVQRIVFSTTLTTNLIAQGTYPPVGLVLIPGPGLPIDGLLIGERNWVLSGSIDHRGRNVAPLGDSELAAMVNDLQLSGIRDLAIIGKFSTRNPQLEEMVERYVREHAPHVENIQLGHRIGTSLNFPRRVQTTWLNTAVYREYRHFLTNVRKAVEERGLHANLFLLKADGGTMPLDEGLHFGVETIKSGPAASIMGFLALRGQEARTTLLLDIGGSTTDIALMAAGVPLFEPEGVQVGDYLTSIRGLLSRSLPYGGDSPIRVDDGIVSLSPQRRGAAVIFGGSVPTLTDALAALGRVASGNDGKAREALAGIVRNLLGSGGSRSEDDLTILARQVDRSTDVLCSNHSESQTNIAQFEYQKDTITYIAHSAVQYFCSQVREAVSALLREMNSRPVYTIHDLLTDTRLEPDIMMVVGGPAAALLPKLGEELGIEAVLPAYHFVANALGAAIARPTLRHMLYADTAQKFYTLTGVSGKQRITGRFSLMNARQALLEHTRARANGIADFQGGAELVEITHEESFQIVRDFSTQGQILKLEAQIKPGIAHTIASERGG